MTYQVFTRLVLPLSILVVLGGTVSWVTGIFSQPGRIVSKTLDADNVLANYEWFKQTYRDVLALEQQAKNAESSRTVFVTQVGPRPWDYQTSAEYARLNAVVLGLVNQRQNLVAQYNARSAMMNRALFKGHDLPEELR